MKQLLLWMAAALVLAACGSQQPADGQETKNKVNTNIPGYDTLVVIKTPMGTMKALLYEDTPLHRRNFLKLVGEGFYDGLLFHRVIHQFMAQGGDPNSKDAAKDVVLGQGGPGYDIPAEIGGFRYHKKGALAAARKGNKDNPEFMSSGSQFYIVQGKPFTEGELLNHRIDFEQLNYYFVKLLNEPGYEQVRNRYVELQNEQNGMAMEKMVIDHKQHVIEKFNVLIDKPLSPEQKETYMTLGGTPFLDYEYSVFGELLEGLDVLDKICAVGTGQAHRPLEDIKTEMSLEPVKKSEVAKKYNYGGYQAD